MSINRSRAETTGFVEIQASGLMDMFGLIKYTFRKCSYVDGILSNIMTVRVIY